MTSLAFDPRQNELYRAQTQKQRWYSHVQKQCSCGRVVTAKQLTQYGMCDSCFKAGKEGA